jgi:hypothetical protein
LWTVKIEQHQDANDDNYYIWLYEGSQWKQKLYAAGALLLVIAIVLFPLWPLFLRQGVWYLSMGMLGLIGLFFAMAIVRLIIFVITIFAVPPGLWLYPNLFEDVGFFDSFRPVWAWQEVCFVFRTPVNQKLTIIDPRGRQGKEGCKEGEEGRQISSKGRWWKAKEGCYRYCTCSSCTRSSCTSARCCSCFCACQLRTTAHRLRSRARRCRHAASTARDSRRGGGRVGYVLRSGLKVV